MDVQGEFSSSGITDHGKDCGDLFAEKGRTFSTSTPLVSKLTDTIPPRSFPSATSPNDSGYDSICNTTPGHETCHTTVSNYTSDSFTKFRRSSLELSPSPTTVNPRCSVQKSDEKTIPKFVLHSLDYEIPEEENILEKFSPDKKWSIPTYSLESLEEEMCCESTSPEDNSVKSSQAEFSSLTEQFNQVLKKCVPRVPDRMIGRKMGLENVDIISELHHRSMLVIVNKIVRYLRPSDLSSMCRVSKSWSGICSRWSVKKQQRRQKSLKQSDKENIGRKGLSESSRTNRGLTFGDLGTLSTVQAVEEKMPIICSIGSQKDLFVQTAQTLKNEEQLAKCPMCQKPSKVYPVQERGVCQNSKCNFDYCVKCFHNFHHSNPCESLIASKRINSESKIGGKRGKKFLRRL